MPPTPATGFSAGLTIGPRPGCTIGLLPKGAAAVPNEQKKKQTQLQPLLGPVPDIPAKIQSNPFLSFQFEELKAIRSQQKNSAQALARLLQFPKKQQ